MRILGHPVHIMIIHFPSALFPAELVLYALFFYTGGRSFADASYYAMIGAVISGWTAVILGVTDLTAIPSTKPEAIKKALYHGGLNTSILIIYSVLAYLPYKKYPELPPATISLLVVKGFLITLLLIGNYWGGELILKHKVAIEN
jgi:uncharacterized membrane protein